MNEELKKDIEAAVSEIFSQKEEAEQKARTEEALQKSAETITQLTEALEAQNDKDSELASLTEKIESLTSELEAAKTEATEIADKLAKSEKTIEEMKKDKATELRMSELASAGVALSNKEAQTAKVREMSDEDFTSYKEELVSVREAVKAELDKSTEKVETEEVAEEETETAEEEEEEEASEEESEEASEEETEETLPAEIDRSKAVAGALNLEIMPSDDVLAKYRKMGEAMASRMKKDK